MASQSNEPLEVFNRVGNMFRTVSDFWRDTEVERLRNYEHVVGRQWKKEDYDYLISNRRSADVYNFILPIILALSGTQKLNRQQIRSYPTSGGDEQAAELMTKVMRWSFSQCDKDFQASRAFLDSVIGRIGWMKSYWSTAWKPEGLWYTDWHDPFRLRIDPETQSDFHRTCNYLFDSSWVTGEMIVNLYAGQDEDLAARMEAQIEIAEGRGGEKKKAWSWRDKLNLNLSLVKEAFGSSRTYTEVEHSEWVDVRNGLYRVIELHERRHIMRKYFFDTMSGNTVMIPDAVKDNREVIGMALQRNPGLRVMSRYESMLYVTTTIPAFSTDPIAAVPQDKPYDIQNGLYMYTPIVGFDFHPDIAESRSLVDNIIDPQQSYNKLQSTLKDYIVRFVGHGWIHKKGSIEEDDKQDWESRSIGINRAYIGETAPEPDIPPALPREVLVGRADDRDAIRAITGVPLNMQGETQTKNEAAALFSQRMQQGGMMQMTMFDALRRADRYLGKHAVDGLQKYLKDERWIRITEDTSDPLWLLVNQVTLQGVMNDLSLGEYDVEIDQTQYSATAKQDAFAQGLAMAKMMPPDLVPWHILVKNSDLPDKQEWIKYIQTKLGMALGMPGGSPAGSAELVQTLLMAQAGARGRAGSPGGPGGSTRRERVGKYAAA